MVLSCAQVEATEKSGEVIFHFKDAPHPARFGRARLRAAKRSAPAPYKAGSWSGHGELQWGASSQKIGRRTGHSQKVVPGLEAFNHVGSAKPGPERSEGPASDMGWEVQREPDHSEGSGGKCPPSPTLLKNITRYLFERNLVRDERPRLQCEACFWRPSRSFRRRSLHILPEWKLALVLPACYETSVL